MWPASCGVLGEEFSVVDVKTVVQKATVAKAATVEDGEFAGDTRYEGSVLVDRKIGDDWVAVLTDKPRPGDRVQARVLNPETGKLEVSKESSTKSGATRMPGKS